MYRSMGGIVIVFIVLLVFMPGPIIAQPHAYHHGISYMWIAIEPADTLYKLDDTITLVMRNICADTLFVTPGLAARCHDGWRDVIADLSLMDDDEYFYNGWMTLWPVAPGLTCRVSVVPRDIIAYGGREHKFQLSVSISHNMDGSSGFDPVDPFVGGPFTISVSEPELEAIGKRGRPSDTIYTVYDPAIASPVVPEGIFRAAPRRLIIVDPFDTMEIAGKTRINIYWPAPSDDGDRCLTITRRQIWLTSAHENPNPNYFYWFTSITDEQYRMIERHINANARAFKEYTSASGFSRTLYYRWFIPEAPYPDDLYEGELDRYRANAADIHYANAKKLLKLLNRGLPLGKRIILPRYEDFRTLTPIRLESALDNCGC